MAEDHKPDDPLATQAQQDLIKKMESLASEMGPSTPAPAEPPSQDDMLKRMEALASEMTPAAEPPSQDELLKRMEALAAETTPPPVQFDPPPPFTVVSQAPSLSAPPPVLPPAPAPAPVFSVPEPQFERPSFGVPAAPPTRPPQAAPTRPPEAAPTRSLPAEVSFPTEARPAPNPAAHEGPSVDALAEMVLATKLAVEQLQGAFADHAASTAALLSSIAAKGTVAAAPSADSAAIMAELRSIKAALAARPAAASAGVPAADFSRAMAEIKVLLEHQGAAPVGVPALDGVAETVRELQASLEMLRGNLERDMSGLKARLDSAVAGGLATRSVSSPAPLLPAGRPFANVEELRNELLQPMAAMKGQLLELTLSYHQLSLRLAVLAANERHGKPGLLE